MIDPSTITVEHRDVNQVARDVERSRWRHDACHHNYQVSHDTTHAAAAVVSIGSCSNRWRAARRAGRASQGSVVVSQWHSGQPQRPQLLSRLPRHCIDHTPGTRLSLSLLRDKRWLTALWQITNNTRLSYNILERISLHHFRYPAIIKASKEMMPIPLVVGP